MKVILSKSINGFYKDDEGNVKSRIHASPGDILQVILHNKTHFICDSVLFPETSIVVFPNQCEEMIIEKDKSTEFEDEQYYGVYVEPEKQILLKNDLFDPDELEQ
jgi:hypothetical protein